MAEKKPQTDRNRVDESSHQNDSARITGTPSRRRLLHLVGAGGVMGLAGCFTGGGGDGDGTEEENLKQSATIGLHYTVTADSWKEVYGGVAPYFTNIMEPLIWASKDMTNEPWLATSWKAQDDKTWVFEFRDDVTFHNGDPLTADEVIWSFERRLTAGGGWAQNWLHIKPEGLKKIDDLTVEFTTSDIYPAFPGTIAHNMVPVLHPDVEETGEPIGTGPYKFEEMKQGQHVQVSAFEDYWNGVPNTKKLTYREITDPNTRALALTGHDVDVAFKLPNNKFQSLRDSDKTNAITQVTSHTVLIKLNTAKSPTDDQKLRQALNWAVPQDKIVESVLNGIGEPSRGPVPSVIPWSAQDSLPKYGPDLAKAKALVDESKYNGETLKFIVNTERPTNGDLLAEAVQQPLQDAGVNIQIQVLEDAAYDDARTAGDGHLFLREAGTNSVAADYMLWDFYYSKGCCSLWYDVGEEFDSLIEKGNRASNPDVKKEAYGKALQMMMEKALVIPLYNEESLYGTYNDIEGLDTRPIIEMAQWPPLKHLK